MLRQQGFTVSGAIGCESKSGKAVKVIRSLGMLFLLTVALFSASPAFAGTFNVFGPMPFQRGSGSPVAETVPFTVPNPGTAYTLNLSNGGIADDAVTGELVSSGKVLLNGTQVIGSQNFNQQVSVVSEAVTLQASNVLSVELKGKPGGVVTIEIVGEDNALPTIQATVSPPPGGDGWNTTPVTVSFECSDAISGIATCSDPITLSSAGAGQTVTGMAVDLAGNTATTTVTVNIRFDNDNDGVPDTDDLCPGTPAGEAVDAQGCSASQLDDDGDGVFNATDLCPNTPAGEAVDASGCGPSQLDGDNDGVSDATDQCPATPAGEAVDAAGCSASQLDDDQDGISNSADHCPGTPAGDAVDAQGCSANQLDSDGDGVSDALDQCPNSPAGEPVDANGCPAGPVDTDQDGVADTADQCPNTPFGESVYADGCSVTQLDSDVDGVANASDLCPGTPSGEVVDANGCTLTDNVTLPADPAEVAPPVAVAETSSVHDATAFLYTGNNPVQTGVDPQTLVPERAAVARGQVTDRFGNPVVGVKVTANGGPEYGQTLSRTDGRFDMAVNGGGQATLSFEKPGYLTVHRQVDVPWQDYTVLPNVVMTPLDSAVTQVQLGAATEYQIAQGSPVEDMDGVRQATLMFPPGTSAEMVLPGGGTQALSTLSVRATEFTVGETGPRAMPADLPPYTAYTYAAELSVDEAMAAGATSVRFSQAVPFYVDNFLDLPVGGPVPVGYYDRVKTAWIPSDDGRIIAILGVDTEGRAELDIDGSGQPANATVLAGLGITPSERTQLAALYPVGKSLWRVPVTHFTPYDCNWPSQVAALQSIVDQSVLSHNLSDTKSEHRGSQTDPDCRGGSIIECQNQVLRESIDLTGVDYGLHYRSDRVEGRTANTTLEVPLTGDTVPPDLKRIEVRVTVGGRVFESAYQPLPNQQHVFTWDGIDVYARRVQGHVKATVRIGYVYDGVYVLPNVPLDIQRSFGFLSSFGIAISESRQETVFYETQQELVGTLAAKGLGGWTLDVHHAYDPVGKTLYLGNGERRTAQRIDDRVITYDGSFGFAGDVPFNIANVTLFDQSIDDVTIAPDGTIYFIETGNDRVRKIARDGTFSTYAGSGSATAGGFGGDGGLATAAQLNSPSDVAVASNGTVFVADTLNHRVRRINGDGVITTVAGSGPTGGAGENSGDGVQATDARLNTPHAVAVSPDGTLYVSSLTDTSTYDSIIRRITPDGVIGTIAGGGSVQPLNHFSAGNLVLSPLDARFGRIQDLTVDRDGVLYILADSGLGSSVFRVTGNGSLEHVAGRGGISFAGDDIPATEAGLYDAQSIDVRPNGELYIAETRGLRVHKVSPQGIITTVLGNGTTSGTGSTPTDAPILGPTGVAVAPDGRLVVTFSGVWAGNYSAAGLKLVVGPLPGFDGEDMAIATEDGSLLYQFNKDGRHLRTINTLTNEDVYVFEYDALGLLTTVTDHDGNVTTIERIPDSTPIAIVSPDGHRTDLSLGPEGYLATVYDPAGQNHIMTYGVQGLLTGFNRPNGAASTIEYGPLGRLIRDENAAGGAWDVAREELADGYRVSMTTALGRTTSHQVENLTQGQRSRTVVHPAGTSERTEFLSGNREIQHASDGTVTTVKRVPEVRWSGEAVMPDTTTTLPSGLSKHVRTTRNRSLNDVADPLSVRQVQHFTTINGIRQYYKLYEAATQTFTARSPEQRVTTTVVDGAQRPLFETIDGLATTNYSYDVRGRLEHVTQGTGSDQRSTTYTYDVAGWLDSITDGLNRTMSFDYDLVGRPTRVTLHDGRAVDYSYDANGNVTSIVPPGRSAHVFTFTAVDQDETYTPPSVSTGSTVTRYDYNLDQQLMAITRPDGSGVNYGYDTGGRLSQVQIPRGITAYAYDGQTGQLASISAPGGEVLSYAYDGALPLNESWSGTISGTVNRQYNNNFLAASIAVNGDFVDYSYDFDDLVIQAGDLTLTRSPLNGLLTDASLGNLSSQFGYNTVGESTSQSTRHGTNDLYSVGYTRDSIGRIERKVETIGGATQTYDYGYDGAGRLTEVKRDGVVVASYAYDSNSNRTAGFDEGGAISATYDAQDRLLSYNGATYGYTANGELFSKTEGGITTSYHYDVLGNLLQVGLPGDMTIDYVIDGRNRRIGKNVNGALVQGFLYQDALNPIAELDGQGNVVARFVYGSRSNVPDYMVKGGIVYRIVADQVGSPRLVVNSSSGEVIQRMDYDAFGRILQDTNPGFQPFGFAGGIYDQLTGFVRFGARDYDPETGRWTAKDPIGFDGGDTNLYGYVINDPVNLFDPNGLILGGIITQTLRPLTRQTAEDAAVGGLVLDAIATGAITGAGSDLLVSNNPVGTAIDTYQVIGGGQTVALSGVVTYSIYGAGATISSISATVAVPVGLAGLGGYEIGNGVNRLYERFSGNSLGSDIYDLFNRRPCF